MKKKIQRTNSGCAKAEYTSAKRKLLLLHAHCFYSLVFSLPLLEDMHFVVTNNKDYFLSC